MGLDGRAIEARLGYWESPRSKLEGGFRQAKISPLFLPGGGTITDGFMNASYAFDPQWAVEAFVQYERFLIPSYLVGPQQNGSARLQITWTPKDKVVSR